MLRSGFVTLLGIALLSTTASAAAAPKGVWFTGGTASESSSAYLGAVRALPGGRLGHGLALRGALNAGSYSYEAAIGKIDAKYVAASAALVDQRSGKWGWANLSAGPKWTRTKLSPNDRSNRLRRSRWDMAVQSDGGIQGTGWDLRWLGNYGIRDEAYHARLQVGPKLGARFSVGPEFGLQGDRSYIQQVVGAFIRTSAGRTIELQTTAGITHQRRRGSRGHIGLALSQVF